MSDGGLFNINSNIEISIENISSSSPSSKPKNFVWEDDKVSQDFNTIIKAAHPLPAPKPS
jgi:hypothetical protein